MFKRISFFVCILSCHLQAEQTPLTIDRGYVCHDALKNLSERRILTSPVIRAVDKFINSILFNKILLLRQHLTNMLFGVLQRDGSRVGSYTVGEHTYSIQQLAQRAVTEDEYAAIEAVLMQAKNDFERQTHEFLGLAKSFKSQMLILIDESLRLHRRKESILLSWAEAHEGQEMVSFETQVTSFTHFATFLHDLLNYLDDLIASCPKAQKVFLQTKNDQEQKIYAQRFKGIYERQRHKIDAHK